MGRAGCIRSNIMQAHTGLDALDPFDTLPPSPLLRRTRTTQCVHERIYMYVYIYIRNRVLRAVSLSLSLSLSRSPFLPVCHSCVYLYPTCIEIARALNPGSGHEIVIPERLTLLPHLAGAPRSSLKVRKVRGRTERRGDG